MKFHRVMYHKGYIGLLRIRISNACHRLSKFDSFLGLLNTRGCIARGTQSGTTSFHNLHIVGHPQPGKHGYHDCHVSHSLHS